MSYRTENLPFVSFINVSIAVLKHLDAFAEFQKATASSAMSICPHGTTQLLLDVFS